MIILDQIKLEREYQNVKWGVAFDDKNTVNDWTVYANIHLAKATNCFASAEEQRAQIMKAAALLVAAAEAFDRNGAFPKRHYDK